MSDLAIIDEAAADAVDDTEVVALSGEVFGALINLSGRRRFTSQRLVLYAVLAAQGQAGACTTAREALALFRGAHASLLRRSRDLPGVFCPELEEAYFGPAQGDARITSFADLAERALNAIEDRLKSAPALLEQLVQQTTPLLAVLNEITSVYEAQSKKHARLMREQLRGIMTDIETIAREAKMVAFNARIVAARSGQAGKEFGRATQGGDGAQDARTGQRQQVEAAAEDHDARQHQLAGPAQRGATHARHQQGHGDHAQRMHELVGHGGVPDHQHLFRNHLLEAVRAKGTARYGHEHVEGADGDQGAFFHRFDFQGRHRLRVTWWGAGQWAGRENLRATRVATCLA